jgi:uncharacterized protein (DUF1499 family)
MNAEQHAMKHAITSHDSFFTYLGPAGLVFGVLAGIVMALAGLGSRLDWWYFRTGFAILKWAGIGGAAAAVISLAGGITAKPTEHRYAFLSAVGGIVIGLSIAAIPWSWMRIGQELPKIHDITTDMANPPQFIAAMPLRRDAANTAEYGGPSLAAQQKAAYPDIKPIILPEPKDTAFKNALRTGEAMGWKIVAADGKEGRIEAVATTFWFGFKDDIVVRIQPVPGGSKVDIRSLSRVGLSDMGMNAKRVRTYLHKLGRTGIIDPKWGG